MIRITCPCGQALQTGDENAGKTIRCPKCQGKLTLPGGADEDFVPVAMVEGVRSGPAPVGPPPMPPPSWERPERRSRDRYEDRPPPQEHTPPEATSGKAVFSMILGLLAAVAALVLGIMAPMWTAVITAAVGLIALVLALLAMGDVKRSQGRLGGYGVALTGLIVGIVAIPMYFPGYLIKMGNQRQQANRARIIESNNLKQIALAMHSFHDVTKNLPPPGNLDPVTGKPLLSWRVHILPYIEQDHLYRQFRLNEPWDSPHNLPLVNQMPEIYRSVGKPAPANHTTYQLFVGPKTPFINWPPPKGLAMAWRSPRLTNFMDGTSNTFLVVESGKPVLWTKPEDIAYDPSGPLPPLGWSLPNQFMACFADGSVRPISKDIMPQTLRLFIDPADGQVIPFDDFDR